MLKTKQKHETLGLDCFNEAGLVLSEKPEGLLVCSTVGLLEQVFNCNLSFDWMRIQITTCLEKVIKSNIHKFLCDVMLSFSVPSMPEKFSPFLLSIEQK